MLGGVCYVDRYAEDLEGVRARIPYFKELGLTYLHLMPLFLAPEPHSDGGYAVSSYRDVNPRLGTMQQLRDLAAELRANGISLVVDFIFTHTSDELDHVPHLPMGPELRQPGRLPGHGRRDAVPGQPGRGHSPDGRRRLHLEAARHAL
jgi:hypothetical protein